jgi:hypothetical protein
MMGIAMAGWKYKTRRGTFSIVPRGLRWAVLFEGGQLNGTFHAAPAALDELLSGDLPLPSGRDPSLAELPDALSAHSAARRAEL